MKKFKHYSIVALSSLTEEQCQKVYEYICSIRIAPIETKATGEKIDIEFPDDYLETLDL